VLDAITNVVGQKTLDVLVSFAPNLSGQSFVALTHFDPDHPERIGFVAAMKPKAGLADFDAFVEKLKEALPDMLKEGKTGSGTLIGVDFQSLQGPGAPDKICVAKVNGWIVTTWGEAALQDWIVRYQKNASTPSLAQNPDYQKIVARVGKDPMTLLYVNYHVALDLLQKQMAKTNPAVSNTVFQKLAALGAVAIGTRFENGQIIDRFAVTLPKQAQLDLGLGATPCPFETLKFTGPNTRLYWASSINCQQYWDNILEQTDKTSPVKLSDTLQQQAQALGLDFEKNILDPLGSEISLQVEWNPDTTWPEAGFFVKLDKPDDFKPTIDAFIEAVRKTCEHTGVIKEFAIGDQKFATLNFIQASPLTPTITENGPYLGIFLTENQAGNSYHRDDSVNLAHNADFAREIGDQRNGASQLVFIDTPKLLDGGYRAAMPYVSLASMFNAQLAALLKDKQLPPDLTWLAPMGPWSCVSTPGDDGVQGYSVSGVGNQGIFLGFAAGGGMFAAQSMGFLPKPGAAPSNPFSPGYSANPPAPISSPIVPSNNGATVPPDTSTNSPAATPPAPTPDATTNAAPAPTSAPVTPDASATPATNSTTNANPPTPDASKSQ